MGKYKFLTVQVGAINVKIYTHIKGIIYYINY